MPGQKPPPKNLDPLSRFLARIAASLSLLPQLVPLRWGLLLLLSASLMLFLVVLFIAVPSVTLSIVPRETSISVMANVLLRTEQVPADLEDDLAKFSLPLIPVRVEVRQGISFDQISRKFTGRNATVRLTIVNESTDSYSLRQRTRFQNQAGMIFRISEGVEVPAKVILSPGTVEVEAVADPEDLYGEIVGDRGNVPAGLKWELPGLPPEERGLLYARNPVAATGGTTAFTRVLKEEDLVLAEKILRRQLRDAAEVLLEERIAKLRQETGHDIVFLQFEELMEEELFDVRLPREFLSFEIQSVPVEGGYALTALAYDRTAFLGLLEGSVRKHVEEGKVLVEDSLSEDGLRVHVISYDDDLQWVKVTAELTARERYRLDPVTPEGIAFAEKIREAVKGISRTDALKIIRNFPEVGEVTLKLWPPWKRRMPELPGRIVIEEAQKRRNRRGSAGGT
jgi:hypothetical protein